MVYYYLRVSRNRNVVLLVKLKDVLDGDRMLGKMGSIADGKDGKDGRRMKHTEVQPN